MESLIQIRLQYAPTLFNGNSVKNPPLIPSTISPQIQKRKLRTKELHAKRKESGAAVSVPEKRKIPKEKEDQTDNSTNAEVDEDDEIPQPVFDRMLRRISISIAVPIGSGMTLIYVLDKLSKANIWDVPGWLPFFLVLVSFGSGALAMAYGTLSTSWDPDIEGSFFGFEQIEKNWPVLWKEEIEEKELEKKRR
jgi:Photosynthesis affected mutant 68